MRAVAPPEDETPDPETSAAAQVDPGVVIGFGDEIPCSFTVIHSAKPRHRDDEDFPQMPSDVVERLGIGMRDPHDFEVVLGDPEFAGPSLSRARTKPMPDDMLAELMVKAFGRATRVGDVMELGGEP